MPSPGTACVPEAEGWGVGIFTYGGGSSPSVIACVWNGHRPFLFQQQYE